MLRILLITIIFIGAIPLMAQDVAEAEDEAIILENYAGDNNSLLLELETLGLIPSGAEESFQQSRLVFAGEGAQFSNFAVDSSANNLLMAATLDFEAQSDELEFCGIANRTRRAEDNRLEEGNNITTIRLDAYAISGLDNAGNIFAFERDGEENSELSLAEIDFDFTEPLYLLLVVIHDEMTVFANGEAVISGYELSLPGGAFAFLYAGMDEDSICQVSNFFAYTIEDDLVDTCQVSTDSTINRRSGAGTDFARLEQLQAGESLEAVGQTIGSDGFTWWLLADDTWVRDDVVDTEGFCRVLPDVQAEGS